MAHTASVQVDAALPFGGLLGRVLEASDVAPLVGGHPWSAQLVQADGWGAYLERYRDDDLATTVVLRLEGPADAADARARAAFDRLAAATPWRLVLVDVGGAVLAVRPAQAATARDAPPPAPCPDR